MSLTLDSGRPEETERYGELLGEAARPGLLVALQGDLGAGKTLFTKGIAKGIGVPAPRYVTSPTFTIHKIHTGRLTLHHLDFYRLSEGEEIEDLGLDEMLEERGICVIEWPDLFFPRLGDDLLLVRIDETGARKRRLTVSWRGVVATEVATAWVASLGREESAK